MKSKISWHMLVPLLLIASIFLTAAAPMALQISPASSQSGVDLVRLTIVNKTTKTLYLKLQGPYFYYLSVKGGESGLFTVKRGTYSSTVYACGVSSSDTIDLTRQKTLIMPICGGNARTAAKTSAQNIDLSTQIKVVTFSLTNNSNTRLLAIFTGAATYVFTLEKGESKDYTIARGIYSVHYYACGSSKTLDFESYKGSKLNLKCP